MDTTKIFNIDAEIQLLGSILNNQNILLEIIDILEPKDFYKDEHIKIYTAITKMFNKDKSINLTTLADFIGKKLPEVGGITYLTELAGGVASTQNAKVYAEIVKDKSNMRKLLSILKNNLDEAENGELKALDISDKLQTDLIQIKSIESKDDGTLENPLNDFITKLEERYKNGGAIQGIETGLRSIDYRIDGLHPGELFIIAGRPAMGKSVVANNIGVNTAFRNKKTCIFNLEMSKGELLGRTVASVGKINFGRIRNGQLEPDEWEKVTYSSNKLIASNLKIYDKIMTLNGIKSECKMLKLRKGLDVVIIDYLQLIEVRENIGNREQVVSHITRQLKLMAKELECTVIALSQLSRACETRPNKRPMLSDLRESGSIEQDADIVSFIYRDEYYNKDTEDKNIIEFILAKQRNGNIGTIKLAWIPQYQAVGELDYKK